MNAKMTILEAAASFTPAEYWYKPVIDQLISDCKEGKLSELDVFHTICHLSKAQGVYINDREILLAILREEVG